MLDYPPNLKQENPMQRLFTQSKKLFESAQRYIPGGVNSPVRAFKAVGGTPIYFKRGQGAYLYDEDDNTYIDYVASWGPSILGHTHPAVVKAVQNAANQCLSYGAPTFSEIELAKKVCELMPSIEKIRMVNSGTEATMSAIRLARAFTQRDKILKFEGCYHGHSDSLLVKAGSGLLTFGIPSSPGVPAVLSQHTLNATFNDIDSVQQLFEKFGNEIATIIVEPIPANMNCILPKPGFLKALREICDHYKSLLIFDEVITGFRVALGGAQQLFNIKPDLITLGKIIGGGLPVGAFGGRADIMDQLSPLGPVYQAGTLSGNPIAMAAGIAALDEICKPNFYENLTIKTNQLVQGLLQRAQQTQVALQINQVGSLFGLFFSEEKNIGNYAQVMRCNIEQFKQFFHAMLNQGIYLAPSAFEAGFVSAAHEQKEINETLLAAEKVFENL
jgi:glutamate-1-semialdehyde 2,1-aminomutase